MKEQKKATYFGTYFDKDAVLRLERWARILAWIVLAAYALEAGYNTYQTVFGALTGGYPLDFFFVFMNLARIAQGGVVFMILQVAAKIMLILMDIEDNTRRAGK